MNHNDILCVLGDCYVNNKPFDYKPIPQDDWNRFTEEFEVKDQGLYDLTNNPSKEEIFDFVYEATSYYEFDEETICSFGNLSLVLMTNTDFANFIIENKIKFKEFIRYNKKVRRLSIEQLKFEDVLFHFQNALEDWRTNTSILDGILLVQLCDYLNVKVETIGKNPANWNIPKYEFEEYYENHGELNDFARLFSKPMNKWYGDKWCD